MRSRHALLLCLLASALLAGGARGPDDDDDDEYEREQEAPVEPSGVNAYGLRTATVTVSRPPRAQGRRLRGCAPGRELGCAPGTVELYSSGAARTGIFPRLAHLWELDHAVLGESGVPPQSSARVAYHLGTLDPRWPFTRVVDA